MVGRVRAFATRIANQRLKYARKTPKLGVGPPESTKAENGCLRGFWKYWNIADSSWSHESSMGLIRHNARLNTWQLQDSRLKSQWSAITCTCSLSALDFPVLIKKDASISESVLLHVAVTSRECGSSYAGGAGGIDLRRLSGVTFTLVLAGFAATSISSPGLNGFATPV